jgi:hypothetical protein
VCAATPNGPSKGAAGRDEADPARLPMRAGPGYSRAALDRRCAAIPAPRREPRERLARVGKEVSMNRRAFLTMEIITKVPASEEQDLRREGERVRTVGC